MALGAPSCGHSRCGVVPAVGVDDATAPYGIRQIFDSSSRDVANECANECASAASNENDGGMAAAPDKSPATGSGLINIGAALTQNGRRAPRHAALRSLQKQDALIGTSARPFARSSRCLTMRASSSRPSRIRHSW